MEKTKGNFVKLLGQEVNQFATLFLRAYASKSYSTSPLEFSNDALELRHTLTLVTLTEATVFNRQLQLVVID